MTDPMAGWPIGRLLGTAARVVENRWIASLDELGLTHAGLVVLHLLADGDQSQTELAARARVQTQTMSRTLDRLERDGHVIRVRSTTDRRRHVVSRTPSGAAAWQAAHTIERDLFPGVADEAALRRALLQVIHSDTGDGA